MIKYVYLTKTGTGIQSWFQENYKTLLIPMDSRKILYLMLTEVEWQIFMYCVTVKCKKTLLFMLPMSVLQNSATWWK